MTKPSTLMVASLAGLLSLCGAIYGAAAMSADNTYRDRKPEDEIIYFVLPDRFENGDRSNDRGGIAGGRLDHGYDPTHKGFYHGGDLKGLTQRLDYIEGLGATAIWLGPIYKNKPVQGYGEWASAGYHGYWILDFTTVDPHLGTEDDLKAFIDAAHGRGMKVYFDIITNHTADVISYRECYDPDYAGPGKVDEGCPYRSKGAYPFTTRGNVEGPAINAGFGGVGAPFQTTENFKRLTRSDFAYTPYIPAGEENAKTPAWLNDPIYYHNRGETTFEGENSLFGDFFGLDDIQTEDPRVVAGFIDIYTDWISRFDIDGFRIDTTRHVNPEFWQAFAPAVIDHANTQGIENFYVFGEVYDPDPAALARFTRVDDLPTVLDFAFQDVVTKVVAKGEATDLFRTLFVADSLYEGGSEGALMLPTFLGNHDMGRFGTFLRDALPDASNQELTQRSLLAHAMMFFMRGVPVIYYGDEQGFVGDGVDQAARENMFASSVVSYNDNVLLGTNDTTASANFNRDHPLYQAIAGMSAIYKDHRALRHGAQILRKTEVDGGVVAVSRTDGASDEYLAVFNTRTEPYRGSIEIDPRSSEWADVHGTCPTQSSASGSITVEVEPLGYLVCRSNTWVAE
ncbi:MAG: alpha-amylase family glycosyl hydrolase [Pseudomonadota bacterium]